MNTFFVLQSYYGGSLPVRELRKVLLYEFQGLYPDLLSEIIIQVQFDDMDKKIMYDDRHQRITDPAYIVSGKIHISEPFLAFIWCLSFAVITLYRERAKGLISNPTAQRAIDAFNYALSLYEDWSEWNLNLPNPELPDVKADPSVDEADGLFIYASCFILGHEFGHQARKHLQYSQPTNDKKIQDEYEADDEALSILQKAIIQYSSEPERGMSIRLGAVIGVGSILFSGRTLDGGPIHPNSEERLRRAIEQMSVDEHDDLWVFGMFLLILWGLIYGKDFAPTKGKASAKDNYVAFADFLKKQ